MVVQAWQLHNEGNILDLVDPNLHMHGDEVVAVKQAINVALLCLLPEGERRPSMARVVAFLQGEVEDEVIESILKAGKSESSYKKFLASAGSGFNLATITESSSLIHRRFDNIVNFDSIPSSINIELCAMDGNSDEHTTSLYKV